jgi:hypothetical protein
MRASSAPASDGNESPPAAGAADTAKPRLRKLKTTPPEYTDQELERKYDLTPVDKMRDDEKPLPFTIDPWEMENESEDDGHPR